MEIHFIFNDTWNLWQLWKFIILFKIKIYVVFELALNNDVNSVKNETHNTRKLIQEQQKNKMNKNLEILWNISVTIELMENIMWVWICNVINCFIKV